MKYNTNCGIYKITNLVNGKIYIGSSKEISKRWGYHRKAKRNMIIHNAIRKYGIENFVFEVLECCERERLIEREQYYYDIYKPEYNAIRPIENPMENEDIKNKHKIIQNSEKYKKKISVASKRQWANKTEEERKYILKVSHTEEANKKRIETMNSEKFKNKASDVMKKIWENENYRKKHIPQKIKILDEIRTREDVKEKITASSKKRWEDEEYREYIISKTSALKRKRVYLHDGEKIREFESISSCGRWIADIKKVKERNAFVNVSAVLRGKLKTAYGYNVSFNPDIQLHEKETMKVVMLDDEFNILKTFKSAQEAAESIKCHVSTIRKVCRGKQKKSGGYKWMYLEEYEKMKSAK